MMLPADQLTVIFVTQVGAVKCWLLVRYSIPLPLSRVMEGSRGVQHWLLVGYPMVLCSARLTEHKLVGKCWLGHCNYSIPIGSLNITWEVKCRLSHCNFYYISRGAHIASHHRHLANPVTAPIIPPPPSSCPLMMSRLFPLLLDRFPPSFLLTVLYNGLLCRL